MRCILCQSCSSGFGVREVLQSTWAFVLSLAGQAGERLHACAVQAGNSLLSEMVFRRARARHRLLDRRFSLPLEGVGRLPGRRYRHRGPALDYAESKGVQVIRETFLSYNFGGQRFQAVTFWAVLEHLLEPLLFLRKAAELLELGGLCFVLVPNRRSLLFGFWVSGIAISCPII